MAGDRVRRLVSGLSANASSLQDRLVNVANVSVGAPSGAHNSTGSWDAAAGSRTARSILAEVAKGRDDDLPEDETEYRYADLWDGLEVCLLQANATKQSTKEIGEGLRQWSSAEQNFVKALPFARRRFEGPENETGTIGAALNSFCQGFGRVGEARARLSSVAGAMGNQLLEFRRQQNITKKNLEAEGIRLRKALAAQESTFLRGKAKYEKCCRDAEVCIALKEKAHAEKALQEVSKLWQRTTDALIAVQESEQQYRVAVEELRVFRAHNHASMRKVLEELQLLEESRVEYTKALLFGVVDAYAELQLQLAAAADELRDRVERTDSKRDSRDFCVRNFRPVQEEVKFEKLASAKIEAEIDILVGGGMVGCRTSQAHSDSSPADSAHQAPTQPEKVVVPVDKVIVLNKSPSYDFPTPTTKPVPLKFVRAIYDYTAQDKSELTIRAGDVIKVLSEDQSGWWEGSLSHGSKGSFPENYTKSITVEQALAYGFQLHAKEDHTCEGKRHEQLVVEEEEVAPVQTAVHKVAAIPTIPPIQAVAIQEDQPLRKDPFRADLRALSPALAACSESVPSNKVLVLYDYTAQDPCDLTIKRRDILQVYGMDKDGGWLDASDATGRRGMVPANYVKFVPQAAESA